MSDYIVSQTNTAGTVTTVNEVTTVVTNNELSTIITSSTQGPRGLQGEAGAPGIFNPNIPVANVPLLYGRLSSTNYSSITIGQQVLDSFSYSSYGAAKYIIYSTYLTDRQVCEILLLHDNFTVANVEYANVITSTILGTFTTDISGSNVRLLVDAPHTNINYKVMRTLISN
jgi:hypothetical protein